MPTGGAHSLYGFIHVRRKPLKLQQWQPRHPRLPCYVSDSDLRHAVCAAVAEYSAQEGYESVAYHSYD